MKHTCPTCKGTGEQTITVHMDGKSEEMAIECTTCDGTKEATDEDLELLEFEKNMWCTCENKDNSDVVFYNDGEHSQIHKHHYRHGACGKVIQIG